MIRSFKVIQLKIISFSVLSTYRYNYHYYLQPKKNYKLLLFVLYLIIYYHNYNIQKYTYIIIMFFANTPHHNITEEDDNNHEQPNIFLFLIHPINTQHDTSYFFTTLLLSTNSQVRSR